MDIDVLSPGDHHNRNTAQRAFQDGLAERASEVFSQICRHAPSKRPHCTHRRGRTYPEMEGKLPRSEHQCREGDDFALLLEHHSYMGDANSYSLHICSVLPVVSAVLKQISYHGLVGPKRHALRD